MKKMFLVIIILFFSFNVINVKAVTVNNEIVLLENDIDYIPKINSDDDFTCKTILIDANGKPTEFKKILDGVFKIIQIGAPVLAIVLTIIDYFKAIFNSDSVKKANARTIKRVIIATIIVFLPMLLDLLFHLFGLYDISTCEIGR